MFWYLVLAHFIADYPLQTDRLVKAKRHYGGLMLHVGVHLVVMLAIVGLPAWPYLLGLTFIHFGIDFAKNLVSHYKPTWIIIPYLVDQLLHILSIWLISSWFDPNVTIHGLFAISQSTAIYGIGYLMVSHVWFITERVITYNNFAYQQEVNRQSWSLMVIRVVCLTVLLGNSNGWLFPLVLTTITDLWQWPYIGHKYGWRAGLTDLGVALATWDFIQLAILSV